MMIGQKEEIPYLSVVIPAYNEEKRIGNTLEQIMRYLNQKPWDWDIVLVDDGSKDRTVEIAQKAITDSRLKILKNIENLGKGASIRKGMLSAKGKFRLFSDADLSTPIEELEKILPYTEKDYGVAIGSRALKESQLEVRQPFYREWMGRIFNCFVRLFVIGSIKDTQCGFKVFTAEAAESIFRVQRLSGFAFDVEVLFLARKKGFKIKEVPVRWINSPASKVHPIKDSVKMFIDILKVRFFSGD